MGKKLSDEYTYCDYVFVCNGHNAVPNLPKIDNSELFKGIKLHTHQFRKEKLGLFSNKEIVIYGTMSSAWDMMYFTLQKLNPPAKKVYLVAGSDAIKFLANSDDFGKELAEGRLELVCGKVSKFTGANSVQL